MATGDEGAQVEFGKLQIEKGEEKFPLMVQRVMVTRSHGRRLPGALSKDPSLHLREE